MNQILYSLASEEIEVTWAPGISARDETLWSFLSLFGGAAYTLLGSESHRSFAATFLCSAEILAT